MNSLTEEMWNFSSSTQTYQFRFLEKLETIIWHRRIEEYMQNISLIVSEEHNCQDQTRLYSLNEAAKKLHIGYDTLKQLIENGRIGVIGINTQYKISHAELIRFAKEETYYFHSHNRKLPETTDESESALTEEEILTKIIGEKKHE